MLHWDNQSIDQLNHQYIELSNIFYDQIDAQCILSYMYLLLWQQYFSNWYTELIYQSYTGYQNIDDIEHYQRQMRAWIETYYHMLTPLKNRMLINSKAQIANVPNTIDWPKINQAFRKETGFISYKIFRGQHHLSNVQANAIYDDFLHNHASAFRNKIRDMINDQLDELTESRQNQRWFDLYDDIFERLNDHNFRYYDDGNSKMYLITQ